MNIRLQSLLLLLLVLAGPALGAPLGTAITYQGKINLGTQPPTGSYDMTFQLYDALSGGNRVGPLVSASGVQVTDGQFTQIIDFGPGVFNGEARWMQIAAKPAGSAAIP